MFRDSILNFDHLQTPFQLLVKAIQRQKASPTRMILAAEILWTIWCERNRTAYQQSTSLTPVSIILFNTMTKVKALLTTTRSIPKQHRLNSELALLEQQYLLLRQTPRLPPTLEDLD
jgi:hypothetical protein